jgi:hypothetical protein
VSALYAEGDYPSGTSRPPSRPSVRRAQAIGNARPALLPVRGAYDTGPISGEWGGVRWDAARWEDRWNTDSRRGPVDPPGAWHEHWSGHNHVVHLAGATDDAAVYLDEDMDRTVGPRLLPYVSDVWQYAKATYGAFGPDPLLYTIFHGGPAAAGPSATYLDLSHDRRNVADAGGPWRDSAGAMLDMVIHEVAHIVERGNNGVAESPALPIWGGRTWTEFFAFDIQLALGRRAQAMALAERSWTRTDAFPRPGTTWFRDWFHPLWTGAGGAQVMVRFFGLLAAYFPRAGDQSYRRFMTWGEYLHFTSGAAGGDLSGLARSAFGWPTRWTAELERARADFPDVSY